MSSLVINGQRLTVGDRELTYERVVELADSGRSKECLHSVAYRVRRSDGWEKSGSLYPGSPPVEIFGNDTVITALVTDNA